MNIIKTTAIALAAASALTLAACGDSASLSSSSEDKKVVMTVGGEQVQYQEYRYFYLNNKRDQYGADASLTAEQVTELRRLTENNAKSRHGLILLAEKYGAMLTEEQVDKAEATVAEFRAGCGDDEMYRLALGEQYMTHELFYDLTLESQLAWAVLEEMIADGAIKTDKATIDAALAGDEVLCLKEIYVTYGTEETRDIAKERAEEALSKLTKGAKFEDLMREYSDYNEVDLPPEHGYYTMKYDALDAIWDAAITLAPGEHSVVVESPYGFHIIKRCEKDKAYMEKIRDEIVENYTYSKFYEIFYPYMESLEVKYTRHGEALDFIGMD